MTVQSVADVLEEAKRLIEEEGWTQGELARDEYGDEVSPEDDAAACFCFIGAIRACGGDDKVIQFVEDALGLSASDDSSLRPLAAMNDAPGRTKEEVLDAFSRAITQARGDAARQEEM